MSRLFLPLPPTFFSIPNLPASPDPRQVSSTDAAPLIVRRLTRQPRMKEVHAEELPSRPGAAGPAAIEAVGPSEAEGFRRNPGIGFGGSCRQITWTISEGAGGPGIPAHFCTVMLMGILNGSLGRASVTMTSVSLDNPAGRRSRRGRTSIWYLGAGSEVKGMERTSK